MEKALFESEKDLIIITKDFRSFSFYTEKWSSLLGSSLEELSKKPIIDLIFPDDLKKTLQVFEMARDGMKISGFENRLLTIKNKIIWCEWQFYLKEESAEFICLVRDISSQKNTEHDLYLTQKYSSMGSWKYFYGSEEFEGSPELYSIYEINDGEKLSFARYASFHDERSWGKINRAFSTCLGKGTPWSFEVELISDKGSHKWVQSWGFPILKDSEVIGVEGLIQDLSQKKSEQLQLKQTVEELDKVQLSINQHCLVAKLNPFGYFMDVNHLCEVSSGYRLEDFVGKHFLQLHNVTITQEQFEHVLSSLQKGEKWRGEIKLKTRSGSPFWVDLSMTPIMDQSNHKLHEIICIGYDITEKKLNDERYHVVISGLHAGIWDWPDLSLKEVYWSPRFYEVLDLNSGEVLSNYDEFMNRIHPEDRPIVEENYRQATRQGSEYLAEYRVLSGNGKYKWIQTLAVFLRDASGQIYRIIGSISDINQKKLTEFSLEEEKQRNIQHSKLATLGEMAAGLAHEVNNPLTIIFGYIRMMEDEIGSRSLNPEILSRHLGLIKNAAQRADKIVTNLKDFSRDGSLDPYVEISTSQLISMVLDLCSERFKKYGIQLDLDIGSDPAIYCRKIEISQVLLNLLFNSFDAVLDLEEKWIRIGVQELQRHVEISVKDSGLGLKTEVAEKIFTPFFTTKKVGKGTGIGLSISQRIILNHGGEIYYDPHSNNTRFFFRLPYHESL